MNYYRAFFSLFLAGVALWLPLAAFGSLSGKLTLQHSADGTSWTDVVITPEMIDEDGRLALTGVSNPSFFRLDVSDFAPPVIDPLALALGQPTWTITTGGDADWMVAETGVRSGSIGDNQSSWIEVTVEGPGVLLFDWKVSSERGFDFLEFFHDGTLVEGISGSVDWLEVSYAGLGSGSSVLRWVYRKDEMISAGEDAGWLANLRIVETAVPEGMVLVEGGTLAMSMGTVTVDTFYIGRYEVTWGEWQTVRAWASANGYDIGSVGAGCADDHPVHSVNWYDVVKWSNAKSEMEGLTPVYTVEGEVYRTGEFGWDGSHVVEQNLSANGYRLPLEAEWEFAARGGNSTNGYTYAGSNDLNAVGWYWGNASGAACNLSSSRGTWPVGEKAPNELGLYDMSGNVWEWCWDRWSPTNSSRVLRGGSWGDGAGDCAVSYRDVITPAFRDSSNGFRLAVSAGQ